MNKEDNGANGGVKDSSRLDLLNTNNINDD
jgi:hypothetical protein